jgi:hypothetical protein
VAPRLPVLQGSGRPVGQALRRAAFQLSGGFADSPACRLTAVPGKPSGLEPSEPPALTSASRLIRQVVNPLADPRLNPSVGPPAKPRAALGLCRRVGPVVWPLTITRASRPIGGPSWGRAGQAS